MLYNYHKKVCFFFIGKQQKLTIERGYHIATKRFQPHRNTSSVDYFKSLDFYLLKKSLQENGGCRNVKKTNPKTLYRNQSNCNDY